MKTWEEKKHNIKEFQDFFFGFRNKGIIKSRALFFNFEDIYYFK